MLRRESRCLEAFTVIFLLGLGQIGLAGTAHQNDSQPVGHQTSTTPPLCDVIPSSVVVNPKADFIIGALLPLRSPGNKGLFECGAILKQYIEVYEALRWAIGLLNQNSGEVLGVSVSSSFIPGVQFGLKVFDSCGHDTLALVQLMKLFQELKLVDSESQEECQAHNISSIAISKIIGAVDLTDITMEGEVRNRLRSFHIATMPLDLETSIPPEEKAKAMISLARKMGWQWAALIYSSDEYSTRGARALGRLATDAGLCLGIAERVPHAEQQVTYLSAYRNAIKNVRDRSTVNGGVFVFSRGHTLSAISQSLRLLSAVDEKNMSDLQWFFSDVDNDVNATVINEDDPEFINVMNLIPFPADVSGFETYWANLTGSYVDLPRDPQNRWTLEYLSSVKMAARSLDKNQTTVQCGNDDDASCRRSSGVRLERALRNTYALPAVHAVFTFAHSLRKAWDAQCQGVAGVCRALRDMPRSEFMQHFLYPLELVPLVDQGFNFGRNVEDGKMAASVRLALSVQRGSNDTLVLVYSENGVETLDDEFSGTKSLCPSGECKSCIRVRESRFGDDITGLPMDFSTTPPGDKRFDIPVLLSLHEPSPRNDNINISSTDAPCKGGKRKHSSDRLLKSLRASLWATDLTTTGDNATADTIPPRINISPLDTCSSPVHSLRILYDYLFATKVVESHEKDFRSQDDGDSDSDVSGFGLKLPLAITTGSFSETSATVAILGPLNYTILNAGQPLPSSIARTLPRLLQLFPSDKTMVQALAEVLIAFGSRHVALVHAASNTLHLTRVPLIRDQLRQSDVCVVMQRSMAEESFQKDVTEVASELATFSQQGLDTVILEMDGHQHHYRLLQALKSVGVVGLTLIIVDDGETDKGFSTQFSTVFTNFVVLRTVVPTDWQLLTTINSVDAAKEPALCLDYFKCSSAQALASRKVVSAALAGRLATIGLEAVIREMCPKYKSHECEELPQSPLLGNRLYDSIKKSVLSYPKNAGVGFSFTEDGYGIMNIDVLSYQRTAVQSYVFTRIGTYRKGVLNVLPNATVPKINGGYLGTIPNECKKPVTQECPDGVATQPPLEDDVTTTEKQQPDDVTTTEQPQPDDVTITEQPQTDEVTSSTIFNGRAISGSTDDDDNSRNTSSETRDHVFHHSDKNGVVIAGAFALHHSDPLGRECGGLHARGGATRVVEAFLWAVDSVNAHDDILPGVHLGALLLDTCGHSLRAARILSDLLVEGRSVRQGELPALVLGSDQNEVRTVIDIANSAQLPTLTLRTPAALVVSGRHSFPYLVPVSSPNAILADAMAAVLRHFDWTYVSLVYLDDVIHHGDVAEALMMATHNSGALTWATVEAIPLQVDDYKKYFQEVAERLVAKKAEGARVVIALLDDMQMKFLLEILNEFQDQTSVMDFAWITSGHERLFLKHQKLTIGALSLSAPQIRIQNFENYFSKLHFSNNTRNPWFGEFWSQLFECNQADCNNTRLTLKNYLASEPNDVNSVINSVYIIAQSIEVIRRTLCPATISGFCEKMTDNNEWHMDVLATMKKIMSAGWEKTPRGLTLSKEDNLDIYSFGKVSSDAFTFVKVGRFTNEKGLKLEDDRTLKSYNNFELMFPMLKVQSNCLSCSRATRKLDETIPTRNSVDNTMLEFLPGSELSVLLLLPVHQEGRDLFHCGPLNAIHHLQEALALDAILHQLRNDTKWKETGITLGGVVVDYCQQPVRAQDQLFKQFSSAPTGGSINRRPDVVAAIVLDDHITSIVSQTLRGAGIPTLSLALPSFSGSEGATVTAARDVAGLVLRPSVAPSDQLLAIISLLLRFEWNHVSVLATATAETDGGAAQWSLHETLRRNFTHLAVTYGICVAGEFEVDAGRRLSDAETMRLLQDMRRVSGSKVVVVLTDQIELVRALVSAAEYTVSDEKMVFIMADHALIDDSWDESFSSTILSLALDYDDVSDDVTSGGQHATWRQLTPDNHRPLPASWLDELWLQQFRCKYARNDSADVTSVNDTLYVADCTGEESLKPQLSTTPSVGQIQRAIEAIATALNSVVSRLCPEVELQSLDDCAFRARKNFVSELNKYWYGNALEPGFSTQSLAILNYQMVDEQDHKGFKKIAKWERGQLHMLALNRSDTDGENSNIRPAPSFTCTGRCSERCRQQMLQLTANRLHHMQDAEDARAPQSWPTRNASPSSAATSNFRTIWGLITSSLSALGALLVIICMVYFSIQQASSTGPALLLPGPGLLAYMTLAGLFFLYIINFAFMVQPGEVVCGVRRFALGVAYALVFAAKLVQMVNSWRRLYSYHDNSSSNLLMKHRCQPRPCHTVMLFSSAILLSMVQVGLVTAWLVFSPPRAVFLNADGVDLPRCFPVANFEEELVVSLAYVMLLMALTVFFGALSWGSTDPDEGREPRWVLCSSLLTAAVWVGWTVTVTHAPQQLRDPAIVVANLVSASGVLVLLFGRKIYVHSKVVKMMARMGGGHDGHSSCCSSAYAGPTPYRPTKGGSCTETTVSGAGGTISGVSCNLYVTPIEVTGKAPRRIQGQVLATDLYPLDVYDNRMTHYSTLTNGRSKQTGKSHTRKKTDDYF